MAVTFARRLLLLGILAVGLYALTWVNPCPAPSHPEVRVISRAQAAGTLGVGAGEAPLQLSPPVPLAGYGPMREAQQLKRPLFARATVLATEPVKWGVLSLELLYVPEGLAVQLRQKAQALGLSELVVAATHTHSGPGGFERRMAFEAAVTGRFHPEVEEKLLEAGERALREAISAVQPAQLQWQEGNFPELVVARSEGTLPSGRLSRVRFVGGSGRPLAQWIFLGAHPTTVRRQAQALDGDWAGALSRKEEERGEGVTSVFQSGGGNASAATFGAPPEEKPERIAQEIAGRLETLTFSPPSKAVGRLRFRRVVFDLPSVDPQRLVSWPLRGAMRGVACSALPRQSEASSLEVDGHEFLFLPAEPTPGATQRLEAALGGSEVKRSARAVSLADGYLGYVETPENVGANRGEARRQYFDAQLLPYLERAVVALGKE